MDLKTYIRNEVSGTIKIQVENEVSFKKVKVGKREIRAVDQVEKVQVIMKKHFNFQNGKRKRDAIVNKGNRRTPFTRAKRVKVDDVY